MRYQRLIQTGLIAATLALAYSLTTIRAAESQTVPPASQTASRPQLVRTLIAHDGGIYNLAIGGDGRTIATSGSDRSVRLFNWRDGVQNLRIDSEVSFTWFSGVALSSDGRTLVTSRSDGTIQARDASTGEVTSTLPDRSSGTGLVAIAADNKTLVDATGSGGDFRIKLWNLETQQLRNIGGNWADRVAITPDGYILVAASSNGTATVWNLISGQRLSTFSQGATVGATAIALSSDGLRVFVAKQGLLEEWNARTGRLTRTLLQTNSSIKGIAVSPNNQTLAIGFGNYIQLRNLQTNRPLYNLAANTPNQQVMSFSPDGQFFFSSDGTYRPITGSWQPALAAGDRLRIWRLP